jgi:hypothetical protein
LVEDGRRFFEGVAGAMAERVGKGEGPGEAAETAS